LAPATPPARRGPVEVVFGQEGNASGYAFAGWSAPENGYTWSIDDRSVLRILSPGIVKTYRLDMNVIPYVVPPVLPAQSLQIEVNGELAHSFDPLPRGQVTCTIPGRLIGERAMVEILLHHPQAAAPRAVAGQKDGRRLAISFLRLCLSCA
jgi:hypothetical protein